MRCSAQNRRDAAAGAGYPCTYDQFDDGQALAGVTATLDTPAAAAANLASRLTTSWFDVAGQCFSVGTRYWADVLERGATPVDVLDDAAAWMRTVGGRREPTWSLPNTVVASSPIIRLRDFSLPDATAASRP